MVDGPQQRPAHEEALGVELVLQGLGGGARRPAGGLGGPQVQELAGVVPLVDGLGDVDALVALEADQLAAGPAGQDLGHLGLADAGLALEQQRALQRQGEEDRRGQAVVGQVVVRCERVRHFSRAGPHGVRLRGSPRQATTRPRPPDAGSRPGP